MFLKCALFRTKFKITFKKWKFPNGRKSGNIGVEKGNFSLKKRLFNQVGFRKFFPNKIQDFFQKMEISKWAKKWQYWRRKG